MTRLWCPTCGAWLGSSTPSANGSGLRTRPGRVRGRRQNVPDIVHFYKTGGSVPVEGRDRLSARPGKPRSLLLINWKPSTGVSWRADRRRRRRRRDRQRRQGLKAYPHKLFLTIQHEPENDLGGAGSAREADYARCTATWSTSCARSASPTPCSSWNSWASSSHADMYDRRCTRATTWSTGSPTTRTARPAHNDYGQPRQPTRQAGLARVLTRGPPAMAPGKPIMLAEWGFNLRCSSDGPRPSTGACPCCSPSSR